MKTAIISVAGTFAFALVGFFGSQLFGGKIMATAGMVLVSAGVSISFLEKNQ